MTGDMHKRIIEYVFAIKVLCLALPLLLLVPASCTGATVSGIVVSVIDGDTICVAEGGRLHRVRLAGIDAPELEQAYGRKARSYLASAVLKRRVRVEYGETDRYGRMLGEVFIGKTNVNKKAVRAGYAWHYVHFAEDRSDMGALEQEARRAGRGLWAAPAPVPPWEYRKNNKAEAEE